MIDTSSSGPKYGGLGIGYVYLEHTSINSRSSGTLHSYNAGTEHLGSSSNRHGSMGGGEGGGPMRQVLKRRLKNTFFRESHAYGQQNLS